MPARSRSLKNSLEFDKDPEGYSTASNDPQSSGGQPNAFNTRAAVNFNETADAPVASAYTPGDVASEVTPEELRRRKLTNPQGKLSPRF